MTGQMSSSIRAQLGVTKSDLAAYLGCSERTIRRMERGESIPLPIFQRLLREKAIQSQPEIKVKTYRINAASMWRYLGKTRGWQRWPWHRRGRWLRWKRFYEHVRSEEQMGRCRIEYTLRRSDCRGTQPAARLIDRSSDLSLS